jgi:UDP-glucose 4-epimerase
LCLVVPGQSWEERSMKILVTGGAGFIGSHVVDAYLEAGHAVTVVDDLSTGRRANVNPAATFHQLDIRDPKLAQVFAREKPQVVNHHAAQIDVRRSVSDPVHDASVNILGSLNVLECSRAAGVQRVVYISSGGAIYGEPVYLPCDENHPIRPICPYGASKHTIEHYLEMYHVLYGLPYTILRYANVYGPRQDPDGEAGVVAIFVGKMLRRDPVTVFGDGDQERDFVYVGDCARANLLALTAASPAGAYNIGSGVATSVNGIFAALQHLTGYTASATHLEAKAGETRRIFLQAEKARTELGWTPSVSLEEGLRRTLTYFRATPIALPG